MSVWSALAGSALAQSDKILVVSGSGVPEKLEEDVADAMGNVGSVISSSGYTGNLRARHQAPDSEEALTKLAPQMGASLIVVLGVSRNKLEVAFRNGRTGRVIDEESVPARGKRAKLAPPARRKLATAAKRALSKVGPAPSASPQPSERSYPQQQATPTKPSRAVAAPMRTTAPARPQPQPQAEEEEDDETSDEASSEGEEEKPEEPAANGRSFDEGIAFLLNAGGGVGSRSILVPTSPSRAGGNQIDTSMAPALDIGVGLQIALGESVIVRIGGAYRTLFALNATYFTATGQAESALSSHSVIVGGSLGFLTHGPNSLGIHVFLGWAYRGLSAAEPTLPSMSVQGPAIRPEFHIPFGSNGNVVLRIAPEFILVLSAAAKLPANVSGLQSVGYGFGGEASLDFKISPSFGLGLQFREARALVPSGWGTSGVENERYIVGRVNLLL
ncbi:MAG TPA: hypothetical protein VFN67_25110 [Polyangiales bacterium]|nr:hypothetical protein [Polyangiales bacterium]